MAVKPEYRRVYAVEGETILHPVSSRWSEARHKSSTVLSSQETKVILEEWRI